MHARLWPVMRDQLWRTRAELLGSPIGRILPLASIPRMMVCPVHRPYTAAARCSRCRQRWWGLSAHSMGCALPLQHACCDAILHDRDRQQLLPLIDSSIAAQGDTAQLALLSTPALWLSHAAHVKPRHGEMIQCAGGRSGDCQATRQPP